MCCYASGEEQEAHCQTVVKWRRQNPTGSQHPSGKFGAFFTGSTEDLRHPMIEALITNFPVHAPQRESEEREQLAFFERAVRE